MNPRGAICQMRSRLIQHLRRGVEADDLAAWKSLGKFFRQPARAASQVNHALVAAKLEPPEHRLAPVELRIGNTVILGRVPVGRHGWPTHFTGSVVTTPTMRAGKLTRREWIVSAGLAGAGLAFEGCALRGSRVSGPAYRRPLSSTAFVRPRISPDLIIRTVVGLRPFRAPGFVVRG